MQLSKVSKGIVASIYDALCYIEELGGFGIAVLEYIIHKIDQLIWITHLITITNVKLLISLKFTTTAKLIWAQGRLGNRVKYLFVTLLVWLTFLLGGIFQGRLVEEKKDFNLVFLSSSQSIFLGSVDIVTQIGDKVLLDEPIEHVVKQSETLVSIGKRYGISIESIKFANNLAVSSLKVGQVLMIPPVEGTLHEVKRGDTLSRLAKKYKVPEQTIIDFNYMDAPYTLEIGQILTIPDAALPKTRKYYSGRSVYELSAYGVIPYAEKAFNGSGQFAWPLAGILTQGFHRYHPAIDIARPSGGIVASDKGTVIRAGWWQGGYGNAVQIDHGNGYVTTYAHMRSIAVSVGDTVKKGQTIGQVGSTGRSTGPHLHFTIQREGKYLNPLNLLR